MSKGHRGKRSRYGLERRFIRDTAFYDILIKERIARPTLALQQMADSGEVPDDEIWDIKHFVQGEVLYDSYGRGSLEGLC